MNFYALLTAKETITETLVETVAGTEETVDSVDAVLQSAINENIDMNAIEKFFNELPEKALSLGIRVLLAILVFFIGSYLIKIVRRIVKKSVEHTSADKGLIQFLDSLVKTILYVLLVLTIASSFGLDATSVVALVGSVGVAIGLAIQGSLSNFVGGVLILMLKPFKIGDYIIEDSHGNEGTVELITLFYTKLKTLDNKIVVLPNGNLANTSMTNVTGSGERMLVMTVGISYHSDMKLAKETIESILKSDEQVDQNRQIQVYVDALADSSVNIGMRCWVKTKDYWATKWRVLETIKERFDEIGVVIPFNQLDIHFDQDMTK